ncbi:replication protein [Nitratifractor salsuginis]|uniref:Bacteriophage lambda Replication protein O N-terminal domain-containing protein n=1 Tax=Nitratifractor salsuginis (strain DSM 16511 / JCM 12458 / E9I37-1) TaxID=749222 RepID=E6WZ43_NITSE|nr:replication protein [Nitratifractor salsuginis]ADV45493.1 hypothetical protein Nitsa_0221 [Nitratifractor salsuginis DSM 16511]
MEEIHTEHYIKVPSAILDDPTLTPAEFRIIMHIVRQTIGFQKRSDGISYSQFSEATGMSRRTVIETIKTLQRKRMISVHHQKKSSGAATFNRYALGSYWNFAKNEGVGCSAKSARGGAKSAPTILELQQIDDDGGVYTDFDDPTSQAIRYAKENFEMFIEFLLNKRKGSVGVKPVEDLGRYRISVRRGLDRRDDLTIDNAYRFFRMRMERDK